MSGLSMREQLAQAFDKADGKEEEDIDETGADGADADEGDSGQPDKEAPEGADEDGEDKGSESESDDDKDEPTGDDDKPDTGGDGSGKKAAKGKDAEGGDGAAKKSGTPDIGEKPPESWKPATREHWSKLPKEVREEVTKREREIQAGLQQAAGSRKVANEYFNVVKPFEQLIRAQNSTPAQAITNLMTTASRLFMGTKSQKAETVAEIIANYDIDIETLDAILSGKMPKGEDDKFGKILDERLKPINELLNTVNKNRESSLQQTDQQLEQELTAFTADAANEFYSDVREDMADIMEMAANRGQTLTIKQAYDRACKINPEVVKVIQQREAARKGKLDADKLLKKRRASSSIKGSPDEGSSSKGDPSDLRSAISQAWDDVDEART